MNILSLKNYSKKQVCPFCGGSSSCKEVLDFELTSCDAKCLSPLFVSILYLGKIYRIGFSKGNWSVFIFFEDERIEIIDVNSLEKAQTFLVKGLNLETLTVDWDSFIKNLLVFS